MRFLVFIAVCASCWALALGASWKVTNWQFGTIATAISFTTPMDGLSPIADNGQGSYVQYTHDGGKTWMHEPAPQEMMYLGGAMQGDSAVTAAMFSLQYSDSTQPGKFNFSGSLGGDVLSQNVEAFDKSYYGATGSNILGGNGVAVSTDYGKAFAFVNVSAFTTEARYGAFPSKTTWYLTGGEWPGNNTRRGQRHKRTDSVWLTKHIAVHGLMSGKARYELDRSPRAAPGNGAGWQAQIVKTTDGGKTWQSVYSQNGEFYFNQISCATEDHCIAVGEADSSAKPGVRILVTTDGGKTWKVTMYDANPNMSIMAVTMLSSTEAWASGGLLSSDMTGYFWHTTDGGATWKSVTVKGIYSNDLSFPSSSHGYATAFNYMDVSSLVEYQ